MARRRYRRYRTNRAKWASNIQEIATTDYTTSSGVSADSITLVSNPIQLPTTVSQIYTVKNIECSFTFGTQSIAAASSLEDLTVYIMYVPQGMNLTADYNIQHPEYIMAYKYIGSPTLEPPTTGSYASQQYQPVKIKTRLSRKLNSGDQIIFFWKLNSASSGLSYQLGGLIRWWTKAN